MALGKLCRNCIDIANELLDRLRACGLKSTKDGEAQINRKMSNFGIGCSSSTRTPVLKTVRQALKSIWSTKGIAAIEERLERYRHSIHTRIVGSLRYGHSKFIGEGAPQY